MFKKTRLQLTLLNSFVFIILIAILGTIIYSFVNSYIYKDVDHSLQTSIKSLEKGRPLPGPRGEPQQIISLLIWDENDQLLNANDLFNSEFIQANHTKFIQKRLNILEDIKVKNTTYRAISVKAHIDNKPVVLEFIRSTQVEHQVMNRLLIIMILGCVAGSILAIVAGFFLAEKALKPIKHAWDKQQRFVSDASHEIRTPLAVIQSRSELLLQEPNATIQEKALDISIVLKECRRLTKLVTSLLTLARSDSNEIEIERKEFPLDQLLNDVVEHYSELASFQGKEIILTSNPPITFFGDKDRIHQLIVILLDNAMKYTNEIGIIQLTSYENKNVVGIIVEDNGIGMKNEELTKIFDRFYQIDSSRTKTNSLGLGLSIAQWIVDKHGGKIKVDSTFGEGSRFELQFSKKKHV